MGVDLIRVFCSVQIVMTSLFPFLGTDPEDVIRNAFACFDEDGTGKINEDRLRELLTTMGDRFTDAEVSYSVELWRDMLWTTL